MTWITGSEKTPGMSLDVPGAPEGWCHAVDPDVWITACGAGARSLWVFEEVPWQRARMAGGQPCPSCEAFVAAEEHALA
jgi:hypothetical protein